MALSEGIQEALDQQVEGSESGSEAGNGQEPGAEQPENLPEKLQGKSKEEIADMYSNLESKLGEQGNTLQQLRGRIDELSGQVGSDQEQQQEQAPSQDEILNQVADELPDDVYDMEKEELVSTIAKVSSELTKKQVKQLKEEAIDPIRDQTLQQQANSVIQSVAQQHDDFDQHVDEIREVINSNAMATAVEAATPQEQAELLENVYQMVTAQKQPSGNQQGSQSNKGTATGGTSSRQDVGDAQLQQIADTVSNSIG